MTAELAAAVGAALGGVVALAGTPVAARVAARTDFYDRPREYRAHARATPFLGGAAVSAAFLIAAVGVGGVGSDYVVLLPCVLALWAIGTLDDRTAVAPQWRLLAESIMAAALFIDGLGWKLTGSAWLDLGLTLVWIVGLVNAFNLMDNLDGACGTVGSVAAAGFGALSVIQGDAVLAGMAFALAAACAGFLRSNLARPTKIFLGDGGSMPIGFLVAAIGMIASRRLPHGGSGLLTVAMMVGVVILDTALVSLSRTRRRVSLATGGRDHLTHRLLLKLGTPLRVSLALALGQALLSGVAIAATRLGNVPTLIGATVAVVLGSVLILVLDTARWRPAGIAIGPLPALNSRVRSAAVDPAAADHG